MAMLDPMAKANLAGITNPKEHLLPRPSLYVQEVVSLSITTAGGLFSTMNACHAALNTI
jgi:hypothetical protein